MFPRETLHFFSVLVGMIYPLSLVARYQRLRDVRKAIVNLTPMSGQDRISPHNINATTTSRQTMRIKKNFN